jgi:hypothetical protein
MRTRKFAPPAMPHLPDMDGDGSPPPFGEVDLTEHGVRAYLIKTPYSRPKCARALPSNGRRRTTFFSG